VAEINVPDLNELAQICDFAETRLKQLAGEVLVDDEPEPSEWEWNCLEKVRKWLAYLEKITPAQEVEMAIAVLRKHQKERRVKCFLELPPNHLTKETRIRWVDGEFDDYLSFVPDVFGGWLWTGTEEGLLKEVPEDLRRIIYYAQMLGIDWIKVDQDADPIADLPVYQ